MKRHAFLFLALVVLLLAATSVSASKGVGEINWNCADHGHPGWIRHGQDGVYGDQPGEGIDWWCTPPETQTSTPEPTVIATTPAPTQTATPSPTTETVTPTQTAVTATPDAPATKDPTPDAQEVTQPAANENWTSICRWDYLGIQSNWWFTYQGEQYGSRPYQTNPDIPWFGEFRSHVDGKLFVLHLADGRIFPFDFIAPGDCNTPRPQPTPAPAATRTPQVTLEAFTVQTVKCPMTGVAASISSDHSAVFVDACIDPWLQIYVNHVRVINNQHFVGNLMQRVKQSDDVVVYVFTEEGDLIQFFHFPPKKVG